MNTLQHVFRRGHIFWWRRIHLLFNGSRLDVRLSLQTANRQQARTRGAVLTASSEQVIGMLNERMRGQAMHSARHMVADELKD